MTRGIGGQDIAPHFLGARIDDVEHMCPECGSQPKPFCTHCHGRGVLTELQLSIWQRAENAKLQQPL